LFHKIRITTFNP